MNRKLPQIRRGEIWRAGEGAAGSREARHVLVISSDSLKKLAFRTIVPIARRKSEGEGAPWKIRIEPEESNGLDDVSVIDASKVGPLPVCRFNNRIGTVSPQELEEVGEAVSIVIECW
jgi:mRNA interferase MazF